MLGPYTISSTPGEEHSSNTHKKLTFMGLPSGLERYHSSQLSGFHLQSLTESVFFTHVPLHEHMQKRKP